MRVRAVLLVYLAGALCAPSSPLVLQAGEKNTTLIILDGAAKEISLKNWKFTGGTRPLTWLAHDKSKPAEALEFREEKSTSYANGILTLVPLSSVKTIDYDHDKKTVRVTVLIARDKEAVLAGSTKFASINKFNVEGEVDPVSFSVQGAVKLQDGFLKAGLKGIRFPSPKAPTESEDRTRSIHAQDKEKTLHQVRNAVPLYKTAKGLQTLPYLVFEKTTKIEMANIRQMIHVPAKDKKTIAHDFELTLMRGAPTERLTLLEKTTIDAQPATLVGVIGQVDVGYKLFPLHTIADLRFEDK